MEKRFGVLGGGSWGTAIIKILLEKNSSLSWYIRNEENINYIKKNKRNPNYLTSLVLNVDKLKISSSVNEVVDNSDILILAIPSPFLNSELKKINSELNEKIIFSALKGVVPESNKIVSEHLNLDYNISFSKIGIITGPCHAEEVALQKLSYLTIACKNQELGEYVRKSLESKFIKAKFTNDTMGVEYASMLKNIYAIIVGVSNGLGYGDNFQSVLISNCVREMKKFIKTIYNLKRDINDTEYLGDLLVTSYSSFSRNRTLGNMLGKGYSLKSAISEMSMISEGYYATKNAYKIGTDKQITFDIINASYDILYKNVSPKKTLKVLATKLN
jgi:glycerol-3-phosphate dehydrogenase (NAD(P)+)